MKKLIKDKTKKELEFEIRDCERRIRELKNDNAEKNRIIYWRRKRNNFLKYLNEYNKLG